MKEIILYIVFGIGIVLVMFGLYFLYLRWCKKKIRHCLKCNKTFVHNEKYCSFCGNKLFSWDETVEKRSKVLAWEIISKYIYIDYDTYDPDDHSKTFPFINVAKLENISDIELFELEDLFNIIKDGESYQQKL